MRCGIEIVPFGAYADPNLVVELAVAAEAAGWEAVSLWDHAHFWGGVADPWVTLAAVAVRTSTIRLITGVSPVPRYRPHLLARSLGSLNALSGGRVVFGAGIGEPSDLDPVGDGDAPRARAARADEALPLIARWCAGETVEHRGEHYTADGVQVCPVPAWGSLPVWVGGMSEAALRRASRWDGWFAGCIDETLSVAVGPEQIATSVERLRQLREHTERPLAFEIAVNGTTDPGGPRGVDLPAAYADAGASWWFESLFGLRGSHAEMLARVAAGPPPT
ncbi:MAG: LLM class flavin-dependent oxidoreductase [Cellulomonadaceae bacterium]|nr:LLM class flavin-dependent oxidoreductase [Cellulomonadaceae bacterium]